MLETHLTSSAIHPFHEPPMFPLFGTEECDELPSLFSQSMDTETPPLIDYTTRSFEEVAASISKLSRELLVTEGKLWEKWGEGEECFHQYVRKKQEKYYYIIDQAREDFARIISNYREVAGGFLVNNETEEAVDHELTLQLLMKIVRKSNLQLNVHVDVGVEVFSRSLLERGWHILTERNKEGFLQIIRWSGEIHIPDTAPNFLGQGGFGRVQKVINLSNAQIEVLKVSCPQNIHERLLAKHDMYNEYRKLKKLHEVSEGIGIQRNPSGLFHIDHYGTVELGLLQPLYNRNNLFDVIHHYNPPPRIRLELALDLLIGLQAVHRAGMIHGDIKPKNCFAHEDENGICYVQLADFGGARYIGQELEMSMDNLLGTSYTEEYFTSSDVKELKTMLYHGNYFGWADVHLKRDIYAMAKTIWFLLISEDPYYFFSRTPWNHHKIASTYSFEVAEVLSAALSENPHERPKIEEIIDVLANLLRA